MMAGMAAGSNPDSVPVPQVRAGAYAGAGVHEALVAMLGTGIGVGRAGVYGVAPPRAADDRLAVDRCLADAGIGIGVHVGIGGGEGAGDGRVGIGIGAGGAAFFKKWYASITALQDVVACARTWGFREFRA
jgi:hypothetical protein